MNLWINKHKFKHPEVEMKFARLFNHLKKRGETDQDADAILKTMYEASQADLSDKKPDLGAEHPWKASVPAQIKKELAPPAKKPAFQKQEVTPASEPTEPSPE